MGNGLRIFIKNRAYIKVRTKLGQAWSFGNGLINADLNWIWEVYGSDKVILWDSSKVAQSPSGIVLLTDDQKKPKKQKTR